MGAGKSMLRKRSSKAVATEKAETHEAADRRIRAVERDLSEEHIYLLCAFWFRTEKRVGDSFAADDIPSDLVSLLLAFVHIKSRLPEEFELLKLVGRGLHSFGKVLAVRGSVDGHSPHKVLAMKVMPKKQVVKDSRVKRAMDELRFYKLLREEPTSPFLVRMHCAFETDTKLYFVLDFYEGGELFFHLKRKRRFTETETVTIAAELASAIGHLHDRFDIVHRNIKPEEVMLRESGHCVLIDCGDSEQIPDFRIEAEIRGVPEYLAPEIVQCIAYGKAVDWWALGILLYELTVGIPPFYSQNVQEMYRKIREAPLLFPPSLSRLLKDLITALLRRDASQRLGFNGCAEVKSHQWWHTAARGSHESSADFWQKLERMQIEATYKPLLRRVDFYDAFDDAFTSQSVVDSPVAVDVAIAQQFEAAAGEPFEFSPV